MCEEMSTRVQSWCERHRPTQNCSSVALSFLSCRCGKTARQKDISEKKSDWLVKYRDFKSRAREFKKKGEKRGRERDCVCVCARLRVCKQACVLIVLMNTLKSRHT